MKRIIVWTSLLMTAAWLPSVGRAQETKAATNRETGQDSSESDHQPSGPHHEITVTATRTPTEVRELGRSVTVLTRQEILASGSETVKDVLESVPGFDVVQSGSYGGNTSVFVRGGESDFNLVLIDGVQVNRPGGEFDFSSLSTANIERIEIVRGPASVLYGTEAVSSTIHIITRSGSSGGPPGGTLRAEAGERGTYDLLGEIDGGSPKVHYAIGASSTRTDGIFPFNSQYRRSNASARSVFELGDRSLLSTALRFTTLTQHYPTDDTGAVVDPNDFRDSRQAVYSIDFRHHASDHYDTKLQYGYHRHQEASHTIEDGLTDFATDIFQANEDRHYVDWQNNFRFLSGHLLTAGLSFKREASQVEQARRRSAGVYVEDQATWRNRWFLTLGLRYDNNDRFASFLTGQADLAVLLNERLKLRGSFGNGFRAPAFSEIIGFPEFGISGNPDLRPEQNRAWEFGLDVLIPDNRWSASATVFFNHFRDLIEFTFTAPPGQPNYVNIEAANSRGFELEGSTALSPDLRLGTSYTFTHTEVVDAGNVPFGNFEEGRSLLRRPSHVLNVYTSLSRSGYRLRLDIFYKGPRDDRQFFPDFTSQRVTLPGYVKVDAFASVPIARFSSSEEKLYLTFRGENILNKDYTELAGFRSPGRRLTGGLEFRF